MTNTRDIAPKPDTGRASYRAHLTAFFFATIALFAPSVHGLGLTVNSVTVTPTSVNSYAAFAVSLTVPNTGSGIDASHSMYLDFDDGTILPSSIATSLISINGTPVTSVSISGRRVTVGVPVEIGKNTSFRVDVSDGAQIRHPSTTEVDTLAITSTNGGNTYGPGSNTYSVTAATSTVTAASVTPSPSVASSAAAYTLGFSVGESGYLAASSGTITVKFPTGTTVPQGNVASVTVNGTSANATGSSTGDSIIVTTPVNISNGGSVSLAFAEASGISNPTAGTKTLTVYTSTETTPVTSDNYTISSATALSVTAVGVDPTTVNATATYSFDFRVSSSGALTATTDTIIVTFPANTDVPSSISTSAVTVESGGFSDNATAVLVSSRVVSVVVPVDVANSGDVSVTFTSSASIENPSNPANYTVGLRTSQDASVTSNPYTIAASTTTVSSPSVSLSNANPLVASNYTIVFTSGSKGRLWAANSTIEITFPSGTTVSAGASTATVNGTSATTVVNDATLRTVTITVPSAVSIGNSSSVTVVISSGITNPGNGTYTLGVETSPEPTHSSSQTYSVSSVAAVTLSVVTVTTNTVNTASAYSVTISGATALSKNNGDYLKARFATGTVLPATIATGEVTVGGQTIRSVTVDQASLEVTVFVNSNNGAPTSLAFTAAANIQNPSVSSGTVYDLQVWTSQNTPHATSAKYSIVGKASTSPASISGTVNPAVVSVSNAAFTLSFTTSSTGKIQGGTSAGSSDIYVDFDSKITVPASISASNMTVDGTTASDVSVVASGAGGVVRVGVPSGVTVGNSTATTVVFNSSAALATGSPDGTYSVTVTTSSDSSAASGNYTLNAQQDLSVTEVTPNPTTVNASAAYTVKFTTGSLDTVAVGDTITITFPTNTFIPSSVPKADIKVNAVTATVDPTVNQGTRTVQIISPSAVDVLSNVTVLISSSAGILNPTLAQSYTLDVHTTSALTDRTSPSYTMTSTSTTTSASSVTVNPASINSADADYTVSFNTGSNGRLLAGTSTITVTLPVGTTVGATASTATVNGTSATTVVNSSGSRTVTITIPSAVSIGNSSSVTVVITDQITNPSSAASYSLGVKTSVETSNVSSNSYTIATAATAETISSVVPSPDTTRRTAQYTINITAAQAVSEDGTITIEFPSGTVVPNGAIINTTITVGGSSSKSASGNSSTRRITVTLGATGLGTSATDVVFTASAGIENPSSAGSYTTLQVWTSQEPTPATFSAGYTLFVSQTSVSSLDMYTTPPSPNTSAQWTWTFTTSANGALTAEQDVVTLLFTTGTGMPASISTSKVTVNGVDAFAVATADGGANADTARITVAGNIGDDTAVTIVIDATAAVITPSTVGPFTWKALTDADPTIATTEASLPVELAAFSAVAEPNSIRIVWTTASEVENLGFHVWRSANATGPWDRVTEALIPGLGTSPFGKEYEWNDISPAPGETYYYRLQDIAWDGAAEMHEPVGVVYAGPGPARFELHQNTPNPFNPVTTIRFGLEEHGDVALAIYSATGQIVRTLVNDTLDAGSHTVVWDGIDDQGRQVASGTYVYVLATTEGRLMHRMTLLR